VRNASSTITSSGWSSGDQAAYDRTAEGTIIPTDAAVEGWNAQAKGIEPVASH
jgi:hypothetical protein